MQNVKRRINRLEKKNGTSGDTFRMILWDSNCEALFGHQVVCYPDASLSHDMVESEELQYLYNCWGEDSKGLSFAEYLKDWSRFGNPKFEDQRQSIIQKIATEGYQSTGRKAKVDVDLRIINNKTGDPC